MARLCNDFAAGMQTAHPGRFGLFATLPMLDEDVDGSRRETVHAFDDLEAEGVGLQTSYRDQWEGDEVFRPIFDELNPRRAFVYFLPQLAQLSQPALLPRLAPSA